MALYMGKCFHSFEMIFLCKRKPDAQDHEDAFYKFGFRLFYVYTEVLILHKTQLSKINIDFFQRSEDFKINLFYTNIHHSY